MYGQPSPILSGLIDGCGDVLFSPMECRYSITSFSVSISCHGCLPAFQLVFPPARSRGANPIIRALVSSTAHIGSSLELPADLPVADEL